MCIRDRGSTPQETLYIGDSTVDAETAQNAGVDFAGVLNGMTTVDELRAYPHRFIMENLSGLLYIWLSSATTAKK